MQQKEHYVAPMIVSLRGNVVDSLLDALDPLLLQVGHDRLVNVLGHGSKDTSAGNLA